jgi:hypothetical protein
MNQNLKIGIAAVAGFAVGFVIVKMLFSKAGDDKELEPVADFLKPEKTDEKNTEKANLQDDSFPLKLGSKGQKVERLQIFLMRNLGWIRKPNGIFDLTTEERCRKYFKQDRISRALYENSMMDKMIHDQRKKAA